MKITATKGDKIWDSDNRMLNPLTPKADKHLFSPYSITLNQTLKVMRIMEMINKYRSSWLSNKISLSAP